MKKGTAAALIFAGLALILDSRCAAEAAREALTLCARTLIPGLFPLLVVAGMLVPGLSGLRMEPLARLLGLPRGGEGIWLLGLWGGFPVGAAAISQGVRSGAVDKRDGTRMLGQCSQCGPAFLFGVLPQFLPMEQVVMLFLIQMGTALLVGACWPGASNRTLSPTAQPLSLPEAVSRAISAMLSVCAWVILAAVMTGFLRRWLFPLMPDVAGLVLTGLLELTNGIFALPEENRFVLATLFVCFGGISVQLQIAGLASEAGLSTKTCLAQKAAQAVMGGLTAHGCARFGPAALLLIPGLLFAKIMVEIPCGLVYNTRERKGSRCCFGKRWSGPASTAASAPR